MVSEAEGADVLKEGGSHGGSVIGRQGITAHVAGEELDYSEQVGAAKFSLQARW